MKMGFEIPRILLVILVLLCALLASMAIFPSRRSTSTKGERKFMAVISVLGIFAAFILF